MVFVARAPFLTGSNVGRVSDDLLDFTDVYPTSWSSPAPGPEGPAPADGHSLVGLIDDTAQAAGEACLDLLGARPGPRGPRPRYLLDNQGGFYD